MDVIKTVQKYYDEALKPHDSGMLSSDNVHPTEKGAKALFARFMVDFPEIMVSE